jgi:hypothetical protein
LALHYTLPLKLEIGVRPRRRSLASLGNLNDVQSPTPGGELCGSNPETILLKELFNDCLSGQEPSTTWVDEIDGAACAGKDSTVLILQLTCS